MTIAGQSLPSFGVLLQAIESSKDVNVLSKPHLLTTDNVKASLSVGQSIPFAAGSIAATTGSLSTTYNRQDVALKLDMTPHLNDSDSVRLELTGEISDVPDGQSLTTAGGPITNKRTITTAVVVRDGESIVLGGLQKESDSISVDKVPFLGDIPLLGRLFQSRTKTRVKQDLLIVLTPHVVRGPEDLRRIFEQRNAERREFMERYTAFQDASWEPRVDYRTKRGLLAEIDKTAADAERESEAVQKARRMLKPRATDGPVDEN
jgi:general secretion pathway protein D